MSSRFITPCLIFCHTSGKGQQKVRKYVYQVMIMHAIWDSLENRICNCGLFSPVDGLIQFLLFHIDLPTGA